MDGVLVVVRPIANWAPGDVIDNPAHIAAVLASEHAFAVVRLAAASPHTTPNREV